MPGGGMEMRPPSFFFFDFFDFFDLAVNFFFKACCFEMSVLSVRVCG
jgi:hypothetical protein